jgi:hypothetical protein
VITREGKVRSGAFASKPLSYSPLPWRLLVVLLYAAALTAVDYTGELVAKNRTRSSRLLNEGFLLRDELSRYAPTGCPDVAIAAISVVSAEAVLGPEPRLAELTHSKASEGVGPEATFSGDPWQDLLAADGKAASF